MNATTNLNGTSPVAKAPRGMGSLREGSSEVKTTLADLGDIDSHKGSGRSPSESAEPPKGQRSNPAGIVKRSNSYFTSLSSLEVEPGFNNRFDMGEIDQLAKSIKANGLLNGLRVQRSGVGRFKIIGGHRRHAALELIAKTEPEHEVLKAIPVSISDSMLSEVEQTIQMFEDNGGKPLLPLEEAIAFKKLRDSGMSIKAIVERVGKKHMHVQEMLNLLEGDEELIAAVKDGTIGVTVAKQIATVAKGDKAKQKELTTEAKKVGKNTKDKKGRRAMKAKIEDTRRAKAKTQGRALKMRALTDDQLGAIGDKLAEHTITLALELGIEADANLEEWLKAGDKDLMLAFTFGALQALKTAAGLPTVLIFEGK